MGGPDYHMTPAERDAFVKSLYDFQQSDADRHVRQAETEISRWVFNYSDKVASDSVDWAFRIMEYVTEGRIRASMVKPPVRNNFTSWDAVVTCIRVSVETHAAEDAADECPWGDLLVDARNALDALTPMFAWQTWGKCFEAGAEILRESLVDFAGGDRSDRPTRAIEECFEKQMRAFCKRIETLRQEQAARAA